ncbi:cytosolic phospholipase A2 epsilon-like [Sceloporus undulatus]|uniref:cytosolic phospholipase A2 epsilon-like n=1 Tax=Sceloporus undulatus TaxID=8520 RepID=UPI001C4BDC4E|nr:cytosolic phospholipase A2 epsilon-like [Sceloporus undulatus]
MEDSPCYLLTVKIIQIKNLRKADLFSQSDCYVSLFLPTASFEKVRTKTIKDCKNPMWNETFYFRIQNEVKNVLELRVHDEDDCITDDHLLTVLFDVYKIQLGETVCLTFPLNPQIPENLEVEFCLESISDCYQIIYNGVLVSREISCLEVQVNEEKMANKELGGKLSLKLLEVSFDIPKAVLEKGFCQGCGRPNSLDVRLGYDLCVDEETVIQKRKKIAAVALQKILYLKRDLQEHEVPVVAVMTTGGGARAFTALHGNLFGLQKLGLLDCISYITGSSGSTWTLSNLYQHADWSQQDLTGAIAEARKNMTKSKVDLFSLHNLQEYSNALEQRQKQGYKTCITDLWGLLIDKALGSGKSSTLSGQKHALSHGQNPLPIYMVLNTRDKYSLPEFKEWMEFTPFEVGLLKYGAYIDSEDFGSQFFMGRMMKKVPESEICFMKGVWSNVFSYNLLDSWRALDTSEESFWHRYTRDRVKDIGSAEQWNLDNENFYIWKDTALDTFPNQLTATSEYLTLVDTAAFLDISYPPLLRPERKVDVIIHLNYSSGSQTTTLDEASRYFSKRDIPFPKVDLSHVKDEDLKECYVFEDPKNSKAPIVVFFPLINDTFKKYKAPGVERSASEMKQGQVDVTSPHSPYGLENFEYTEEDFDKLVGLTSYNIQNNKYLILQALYRAIERKGHQKK